MTVPLLMAISGFGLFAARTRANRAPVISGFPLTVKIGPGAVFDFAPFASGEEGDVLRFVLAPDSAALPSGCSLEINGVSSASASAALGTIDRVKLRVADGRGGVTDSPFFSLQVTESSDILWSALPRQFSVARSSSVDVGLSAVSSAGYKLKFTLASGSLAGTGVRVDGFGKFVVDANATLGTIPNLSLLANDGHGANAQSPAFSLLIQAASSIALNQFPVGFTFTVGVPSSVNVAQYFSGSPSSITLNKYDPADEVSMSGVSYNPATKTLSYDGSPGTGMGSNFVLAATDGANPVHELILPSSTTRTWYGPAQGGPCGHCSTGGTNPIRSALVMGRNEAPELLFENRMGDWWDASYPPARQGTMPWYTFTTLADWKAGAVTLNTYDVTQLVQLWQSGEIPNYGFFLTQSTGNADAYFFSPAKDKGTQGPFLNLTYVDGTTDTLLADVASSMSPNAVGSSLSTATRFRADYGICYFNLASKTKRIKKATWTLYASNTYGAMTFKVFALRWEGQRAGDPVIWGLAQNYVADAGLESDSMVMYMEKFRDKNFFTRGAWYPLGSSWALERKGSFPPDFFSYIVGDTDPKDSHYVPLKSGIPAIKWIIPAGSSGGKRMDFSFWGLMGSGPSIRSSYTDIKECYARWYQRFADDFNVGGPDEGGHLSGLCGEDIDGTWTSRYPPVGVPTLIPQTGRWKCDPRYGNPRGALPAWANVTNFQANPDHATNPLSLWGGFRFDMYAYDAGAMGGGSGSGYTIDINHRGMLRKNRWYCIEQYVKVNSDRATPNGIIRVWIDGRLGYERTNARLVVDSLSGITNFSLGWYYGGTNLSPNQLSSYMTNMVFARSYIGPGRF